MEDYFEGIVEAHRKTFDWMFHDKDGPNRPELNPVGPHNGVDDFEVRMSPAEQERAKGHTRSVGKNRQWSNFVLWWLYSMYTHYRLGRGRLTLCLEVIPEGVLDTGAIRILR